MMAATNGNGGRVKGWLGALLPVVREGGPITLLIVLFLGGLSLWFLNGEMKRQQDLTKSLVQQLLDEKERRIALTERWVRCPPP